jgi:hypothetical protein
MRNYTALPVRMVPPSFDLGKVRHGRSDGSSVGRTIKYQQSLTKAWSLMIHFIAVGRVILGVLHGD